MSNETELERRICATCGEDAGPDWETEQDEHQEVICQACKAKKAKLAQFKRALTSTDDMLALLSQAWEKWLTEQRLPLMSTEELLYGVELTDKQREWVTGFEKLWDMTEAEKD